MLARFCDRVTSAGSGWFTLFSLFLWLAFFPLIITSCCTFWLNHFCFLCVFSCSFVVVLFCLLFSGFWYELQISSPRSLWALPCLLCAPTHTEMIHYANPHHSWTPVHPRSCVCDCYFMHDVCFWPCSYVGRSYMSNIPLNSHFWFFLSCFQGWDVFGLYVCPGTLYVLIMTKPPMSLCMSFRFLSLNHD